MMRTNNSKRSVPTNRLPDWDLGVDYVEINAREKSKQILLNHCRKKYSFPCLGASNFDQERQKSGFQRRCNAHIGPNDIENSSSSDWRRPCIGCLSELVGNMAVYNAAPHFGVHPRYGEQVLGRLQKWPLSRLICTPQKKNLFKLLSCKFSQSLSIKEFVLYFSNIPIVLKYVLIFLYF